jgi:hypothetical protein
MSQRQWGPFSFSPRRIGGLPMPKGIALENWGAAHKATQAIVLSYSLMSTATGKRLKISAKLIDCPLMSLSSTRLRHGPLSGSSK